MLEKFAFIGRWYDALKVMAGHKKAEPTLAAVSFIESSVFPIPPDVMLIPMVMSRPDRAWRYALVCTIASVLGGILGYFLGMLFWDSLMQPLLEKLGKSENIGKFEDWTEEYGGLAVFGAALTPFPFKVITIASGAFGVNFAAFIAASVLGRSLRFFLVAAIVKKFGAQAEDFIRKHFALMTFAMFALTIGGFLIWKYGFSG